MTLPQIAILAAMEYISLMLIVSGVVGKMFLFYTKPLLLFAPVYVLTVLSNNYINWLAAFVIAYILLVLFVKTIYNRRLGMAIYISAVSVFIALIFIQPLATFALGLYLSGLVEVTFNNGLIAMSLTLIFTVLFYLLPLHKISQITQENYKYLVIIFCALLVSVYFMTTSAYYASVDTNLIDLLLSVGISSILISICYSAINFVWERIEKRYAQKKFNEFESLPAMQSIRAEEYERHLKMIHLMSVAGVDDDRAKWYIQTHLNNFEDEEVGLESRSRLNKLDNKALAAYLYVKIRHLRKQGYKCVVTIFDNSAKTQIKTSKIMEALDIMIDEALQTADTENSNLNIILSKSDDGRPCIDVANKNELVTLEEIKQMALLEYSLKSRKIRGLRKLNKIGVKYNCGISLQEEKTVYGKYLKFGLEI